MGKELRLKVIRTLKVLLALDDPEIVKCTIESLIEELEEIDKQKKGQE